MRCLICKCDCTDIMCDCATRKTDGAPVCPECTEKVRKGNRDTLDKLANSRTVHA